MEILDKYIEATNTHNFDEVKKLLHPNALYYFSNRTCTTHQEIQAYFENAWSIIQNEIYKAQDIQWLHKGNDSATCTYTYCYEGYMNGKYTSGQGRATNVFVKDTIGWLLIHEHLSPLPAKKV
ncbi:YybH family protein [Brevibacillus laterosporus]|uniref:YybH family protein n=1 Tax=Brevibacillus laterosporus TaxID=1465 RepID=UPI001EF23082|nr:nuclear transport factor 2 family protein [Brevibacillus laterosporus]MCG7317865.1 nuclear transport factor 2 family protein [Brevibacillus laterosporus]